MRFATAAEFVTNESQAFLSAVEPSLTQGKMEEALRAINERWSLPQIVGFLGDGSADVRKVAALALSLAGDGSAIKPLAVALHDGDAMVSQMAEHALWGIWFRNGKPRAVQLVKCGNHHLHHGNYATAIEKFTHAIQEDADFAEAYNQRAIAYYLSDLYEAAIADTKKALELIPQHFGAMAGMGHCYAHLGDWKEARHCYRLALAIHPGLEGIEGSLGQIERMLKGE